MLAATCNISKAINPFSGKEVSKTEIASIVVYIDMLVIILFLIYIEVTEKALKMFVDKFKDNTIEMTDFTIQMKNLPEDKEYGGNTEHLKAYLHAHFS
jgi:hypothetical protein